MHKMTKVCKICVKLGRQSALCDQQDCIMPLSSNETLDAMVGLKDASLAIRKAMLKSHLANGFIRSCNNSHMTIPKEKMSHFSS